MEQKEERTYRATLGELELKTWESSGRYPWNVMNSKTGEEVAVGEATGMADAMIAAAQAAGAEWGVVKWRGSGGQEEE